MNYFFLDFISLLLISLILYTIFYFKNIKWGTRITSCIHIPFIAAATISLLLQCLPDSHRTGTFYTFIILFGATGTILAQFEKNKFKTLSQIALTLSLAIANLLAGSIFLLYHIPTWIIFPAILIYIALITGTIIISKKQKYYFYFTVLFPYGLSLLFIICTFFNLIAYKDISSILLFISAISILLFTIYNILDYTNLKLKFGKFISHIVLVLIYCLISAGFTLMLF